MNFENRSCSIFAAGASFLEVLFSLFRCLANSALNAGKPATMWQHILPKLVQNRENSLYFQRTDNTYLQQLKLVAVDGNTVSMSALTKLIRDRALEFSG